MSTTAAENHLEEDGDFRGETKYKHFSAAVERALKGFEVSTEWPDLISSLAKLNKVLLAYMQYPVVPYQLMVCKRLSQCLHPNLPGGVHLKALDVYKAIFSRIKPKGLASNLLIYSSGLFPLVGFATMSVRPSLLDIYEQYYLPLGEELLPALHGLVLGLLPGLEDESEHTERICQLLDNLCAATDQSAFFYALWQCVLSSPGPRLPAINLILSKLNRKLTVEDQVHCLGGNLLLVSGPFSQILSQVVTFIYSCLYLQISALSAALTDRNVLVGRPALDITSILFPFHQPFLLPSDTTTLLSAALETLLKRDVSLNRRLYGWLLGLQVNKSILATHLPRSSVSSSEDCSYFESYAKVHLLSALRQILSQASMAARHSSRVESIFPYRLLKILMDKQEVGEYIVREILLNVVSCLKQQVEVLGGLSTKESSVSNRHSHNLDRDDFPRKPASKKGSLKAEILQSANLFFNSLGSELLWEWMGNLLSLSFRMKETSTDGEAKPSSGNVQGSSESLLSEGEDYPVVVSQRKPVILNSTEQLVARGEISIPPCSTTMELVTFLLQLLDSLENAHQWQLPNLLLFVLDELIRHKAELSFDELHSSLELISFILQELLRSPSSQMSSRASTPHSLSSPHPTSRMLGTLHPSTAEAISPASPRNHIPSFEGASQQMSEDGISQRHFLSPIIQPLQEMGAQIFADYLTFFSSFISSKINNSNGKLESQLGGCQRCTVGRTLSKEVQTLFSAACQLLLLASQLAPETALMGTEEFSALSEPPAWLAGLMSTCLGSYCEHVTFVALETLLRLLEVAHLDANRIVPDSHPTLAANLLHFITVKVTFLQSVSKLLWNCLAPDCPSYHIEASTLLSWLHSLIAPSSACEMVILENLASKGLAAYHKFAVLWQYMPSTIHQTSMRPFSRVLMRMLEGLQNKSVAVSHFVQSWVKFATERSELRPLLQPLVRILLEADALRTKKSQNGEEEDACSAHAKYYYTPKDVTETEKEENTKEDQFSAVALQYTQVFDARQVLYAFSLLQSILAVDPVGIISSLGEVVVNTSTYASVNQTGNLANVIAMKCNSDMSKSDALHTQKSLLELLLATCVDFLRSEYPDSLEMSPTDCLDNLHVKISAAELLSTVLHEFVGILASQFGRSEEDEIGGKMSGVVSHPSYVSALVTLCDIQRVVLLLSAHVVQCLRDIQTSESTKQQASNSRDLKGGTRPWNRLHAEQGASPSCLHSALRSLFVHLQKLLQKLIALDAQCSLALNPTTPISTTVTAQPGVSFMKQSGKLTSQIHPSLSTAAQPLFQTLLLDVLTDPSLIYLHGTLLSMFTATLPNLLTQLDELAPKVLKQICKNLETILQSIKATESAHTGTENDRMHPISSRLFSGELAVSYLESLVAVVLWCYFGDGQVICPPELSQHVPNMFWKVNTVSELEHTGDSLSPSLKQPSTMSWLFGVFSTSNQKGVALSDVGTKNPCVGINSRVGQYVLMLLPAVYNAVTEIWRHSAVAMATSSGSQKGAASHSLMFELDGGSAAERKKRMEFEDVRQLISWLLCPLAEHESSAFFSSISHIWLEWNLEAKVQASKRLSKKKESFIEMLHQIKVLPLERFIRCVQFTVNDITRLEDFESGVLRQKYLLHFLYKYISSTLQSSEELATCRGALIMFLRDCFMQSYNPSPQYLFSNCHILCMLTSILHVYVCRVPAPEQKKQKKERKELQDVTHKLCEALSMTANVGLVQDYVLVDSRSSASEEDNHTSDHGEGVVTAGHGGATQIGVGKLEHSTPIPPDRDLVASIGRSTPPSPSTGVTTATGTVPSEQDKVPSMSTRPSPSHHATSTRPSLSHHEYEISAASVRATIGREGDQPNLIKQTSLVAKKQLSYAVTNELQLPTIQALAVLSNVLSHFIDCVFESSEKDKVHSLLKAVLSNVWPHLQNHSPESQQCYRHSVKLLSSLSEFQVTRKTWRRETFDLFLANNFFVMDTDCLKEWKVIVDNLMTQDKVTFRDLLGRVGYSSTPGVINIFSSLEHEALTGARLLKRMTFAILSGERDQYVSYLPDVQEKLSEYLKFQRHPLICTEVFLSFRVLLLKFSPLHLEAFWPAIVAELLIALGHLERDLAAELASHVTLPREKLQFFLSACKLLDTAVALPAEFLPHFQLLWWGFQPHSGGVSASPVVTKICRHFSTVDRTRNFDRSPPSPPCLQMQTISSIRELRPLFELLHTGQQLNSYSTAAMSNLYTAGGAGSRLSVVERVIFEDFMEQI